MGLLHVIFSEIAWDGKGEPEFVYPLCYATHLQRETTFTYQEFMTEEAMRAQYGSAGQFRGQIGLTIVACLSYMGMLRNRGVLKERMEAPTRLNKARGKKGLAPIGDRYKVRLALGKERYEGTPLGEYEGGTHRFLGRRGHERTFRAERYKAARGKTIWVPAVRPHMDDAWDVDRRYYEAHVAKQRSLKT